MDMRGLVTSYVAHRQINGAVSMGRCNTGAEPYSYEIQQLNGFASVDSYKTLLCLGFVENGAIDQLTLRCAVALKD